jgi:hypothetical protein
VNANILFDGSKVVSRRNESSYKRITHDYPELGFMLSLSSQRKQLLSSMCNFARTQIFESLKVRKVASNIWEPQEFPWFVPSVGRFSPRQKDLSLSGKSIFRFWNKQMLFPHFWEATPPVRTFTGRVVVFLFF